MDSSFWPENLPADREKAIKELVRGREFAKQLRLVLSKPTGNDDGSSPSAADDLVIKVLGSFNETLSIFMNSNASDEVSQVPATTHVGSPCWHAFKSEDSGDSSKTSPPKDRRGCYKRRKTAQTWTTLTPTLIDDGHAWRKYGQKLILNAKHPRNYYRCTHKYDQGCPATKQVQRTEDETPMYRTTYNGQHKCKNLKAAQLILDSTPPTPTEPSNSILLSFGPDNKPNHHHDPFFSSYPLIKQEDYYYKDHHHHNMPTTTLDHNQSSSSDFLIMSPDHLTAFESSGGPMTVLSSAGSDHGDVISSGVYSCTASTHSLDVDMMVGSVGDFDDLLFEFA